MPVVSSNNWKYSFESDSIMKATRRDKTPESIIGKTISYSFRNLSLFKMTDLRLCFSFYLLFGIVLTCTEKPNADREWSMNSKLASGSRFMRVFLKFCGSDVLTHDQLEKSEHCSYKQKLVSRIRPKQNHESLLNLPFRTKPW